MNRVSTFILIIIISLYGCSKDMIIDDLLKKELYSQKAWKERGLNPSPDSIITSMNIATKEFLIKLNKLSKNKNTDNEKLIAEVTEIVDDFPWDDFDREEKDFIADVIAPAIDSLGVKAWDIL